MLDSARNGGFLVDFQPMSPEQVQRMMQFLLQQQAQFAANFAKSQERFEAENKTLSAKTGRIAEGLIGLTSIVGQLAASQERTDAQFREADGRLQEHIDQVESHLNLVIGMFERHLRDDHGRTAS